MINHLFQWEWLSGWQNVPAYACNMSQRWHQYRPSRTCLYLCTSDIWICWFGRFAFVKPSRQVISTLPLERRWISPPKIMDFLTPIICICSQVIYPHLSEFVVFYTAHQSEFICPTHFHSALPTVWWMVMERNIWWWMVMDKGMEHRRISPKKKLYLPTPIICICRQVISTFVRVSRLLLTNLSPSLTIEFGVAFVNKQLKKYK